jgi:polygalacturonase
MKRTFLVLCVATSAAAQPFCTVEKPTGQAIQAAIDACSARGGGVAYVPPGEYVTGPLWLKENVELRLEAGAVIALSQDPADWPAGTPAIVNSQGVKNIAITGRGTIDGRARYQFSPARGADPEIAAETEIAREAGVDMRRVLPHRRSEVRHRSTRFS